MKATEHVTDSMFYIMAALTEPRHGYAIMTLIEEISKGAVVIGPASMYTIIKKMHNLDWIYLFDATDARRKTYALTTSGQEVLMKEIDVRKQLIELAEASMNQKGGT
ncbi:PadR family transcriptional regulator [Shouchella sp. 1P09AA]|uniref:PadR family transcriptional regulator n=1 Tax=unclassified Shouchella TaxID=2893065 RepID=UPI0039A3C971